MSYQPKIALVHDDFIQAGGAESLFTTIASIWPSAPIYTSLVDWDKLPSVIDRSRVRPSFIQNIPFAQKFYKALLPLYPLAFESFDFSEFDLVISSTTRFAKSIITKPDTIHICYINSLPRFLYDEKIQSDYLPRWLRILIKPLLSWLQRWDRIAAQRVDFYIANSQNIKNKVNEYYQCNTDVIYPFVDLSAFRPARVHKWSLKAQNYYLVVSRLSKWKKIDVAIKAAVNMGISLKIVGTGPDEARLKRLAVKCQIEFMGRVGQKSLVQLYQNAQALIVTQEEDFGIAAIEASACGIPVIAYKKGGLQEIIIDGQTGIFFEKQSPKSLEGAIARASKIQWKVPDCRKNAMRFSWAKFVEKLKQVISSKTVSR